MTSLSSPLPPLSSSFPLSSPSPSSSSSLSLGENDGELLLEVPHEFMNFYLGFVVDAGASLSKVIYRSKKDYDNGKLKKPSDRGLLRLKNFTMASVNQITDFLRENCDVISTGNGSGKSGDDFICYMTGVATQHFKAELEETFGIKIKLYSEATALQNLTKSFLNLNIGYYDYDFDAFSDAVSRLRTLTQIITRAKAVSGDNTFNGYISETDETKPDKVDESVGRLKIFEKNSHSKSDNSEVESPLCELLSCTDERRWTEKYLKSDSDKFVAPATLTMFGSSSVTLAVSKDYNLTIVDFCTAAGKTLLGLMEELVGEKDFDKFIAMAVKGDLKKVTTLMSDLKNDDHTENDQYALFPDDYPALDLGKLSSANPNGKGSYSKEDIAVGLLNTQMYFLSKFVLHNSLLQRVNHAYFCGSIMKYELVRKMITKHFIGDALWFGLGNSGNLPKPIFVRQPGFLVALGVWCANLELIKKQ